MLHRWMVTPALVTLWATAVGDARATTAPPPPVIPEPLAVAYLGQELQLPTWAIAVAMPRRVAAPISTNNTVHCSVQRDESKQKCSTVTADDGARCSTVENGLSCSTLLAMESVCSAFLMNTQCSTKADNSFCSINQGSDNRCSVMNVKKSDPAVGGRTCSTDAGVERSTCSVNNDRTGFCSVGQGSQASTCSATGGNGNVCSIVDFNSSDTTKCSIQHNTTGTCSVLVKTDTSVCSISAAAKGECTALVGSKSGLCSTFNNGDKKKCSVINGKEVEGPKDGKCKGRG